MGGDSTGATSLLKSVAKYETSAVGPAQFQIDLITAERWSFEVLGPFWKCTWLHVFGGLAFYTFRGFWNFQCGFSFPSQKLIWFDLTWHYLMPQCANSKARSLMLYLCDSSILLLDSETAGWATGRSLVPQETIFGDMGRPWQVCTLAGRGKWITSPSCGTELVNCSADQNSWPHDDPDEGRVKVSVKCERLVANRSSRQVHPDDFKGPRSSLRFFVRQGCSRLSCRLVLNDGSWLRTHRRLQKIKTDCTLWWTNIAIENGHL